MEILKSGIEHLTSGIATAELEQEQDCRTDDEVSDKVSDKVSWELRSSDPINAANAGRGIGDGDGAIAGGGGDVAQP